MILATLSIFGQTDKDDFNQKFNKRPLQDFADGLNVQLDSGKVDLDKPFSITVDGYLTKDGRLDIKRTRFTKSEGDRQMVEIAKQAIEAVSDSNILLYLQQLGVEKVKINFSQNEKDVLATIFCELPTMERARVIVNAFNAFFAIAKQNVKEPEVKALLNATNVTAENNNFILNVTLPKVEAHRLLKQKLSERMSFESWLKHKVENNEVDLNQPFLVEMQGWMNEEGKIEKQNLQILKSEGDAGMAEAGQRAITEIAGNGLLRLLKDNGLTDVSFRLQGDAKEFSLVLKSYAKTKENAENLAQMFNQMSQSSAANSSESSQTKWAIEHSKASADNNYFKISFWFPRQEMIQIIRERLKETNE